MIVYMVARLSRYTACKYRSIQLNKYIYIGYFLIRIYGKSKTFLINHLKIDLYIYERWRISNKVIAIRSLSHSQIISAMSEPTNKKKEMRKPKRRIG